MAGGLEIVLPFGGEDRTFRLTLGGLRRVQDKCDAGPEELAARLAPAVQALEHKLSSAGALIHGLVGRYRIDDIRETIHQALLGGGADAVTASQLVAAYVDEQPIRKSAPIAYACLMALLEGVPDDPVGEGKGEPGAAAPVSPEASSGSRKSTRAAAGRGSRRRKSTT